MSLLFIVEETTIRGRTPLLPSQSRLFTFPKTSVIEGCLAVGALRHQSTVSTQGTATALNGASIGEVNCHVLDRTDRVCIDFCRALMMGSRIAPSRFRGRSLFSGSKKSTSPGSDTDPALCARRGQPSRSSSGCGTGFTRSHAPPKSEATGHNPPTHSKEHEGTSYLRPRGIPFAAGRPPKSECA